MQPLEARDGQVLLRVRVQPKASRNEIRVRNGGAFHVALTAPPVDGAANKALCALIAKAVGCPKGAVRVCHGEKSRDKTLKIDGVSLATVQAALPPA